MGRVATLEYFDQSDRRPVADKQRRSFEAARWADTHGLSRVLVAEHHAPLSPSASPVQWASVVASHTTRVRVGTAVSLLRLRDAYLTAVEFATLGAIAGCRVDVGLGRADFRGPGSERLDGLRKTDDELDAAIGELRDLLLRGGPSLPAAPAAPEFWLHGASPSSAVNAVRLGTDYCFGLFFRDDLDVARDAVAHVAAHSPGRTALAVSMVANRRPARAAEDAMGVRDVAVNLVGGLAECADAAARLLELTGADELVVGELSSDVDDHLAALEVVADAVGRPASVAVDVSGPAVRGVAS